MYRTLRINITKNNISFSLGEGGACGKDALTEPEMAELIGMIENNGIGINKL